MMSWIVFIHIQMEYTMMRIVLNRIQIIWVAMRWSLLAMARIQHWALLVTIGYAEIRGALIGLNWVAILKWPEIEETFVAWPLMQRIRLCKT